MASFSLTPDEIWLLVLFVVLVVAVIGVLLYMIRRLRERRAKLLGELQDRPHLMQDRAFNRLSMARRETEILAKQGTDVARPRDLIAQAQGAFDVRNYDRAYQLAQQAHEALVHSRMDTAHLPSALTPNPLPPVAAAPAAAPSPTAGPVSSSEPAAPASSIPKNRAESQFQLRLLDQELDSAQQRAPTSAATREAVRLRTESGSAFDHGDYTEAFRLALKGRRAIGAPVESLPLTGVGAPLPNGLGGERSEFDAAQSAEKVAGAERCPTCGYPALPGDSFCRGCGEPRNTTCANCGSPRQPTDTFCGRCGSSFA